MIDHPVAAWHRIVRACDPGALDALLADDAEFVNGIDKLRWNDAGRIASSRS